MHATQSLKGLDHRVQAPRWHVLVEFLVEPLEAFGVCGDGTDIVVKANLLRWGRADHFREPAEMGWAPMGPARGADIVAEQARCEAKLRVFEIAAGLCTCPAEVAYGVIFHLGDRDCGEVARARQPGQVHSISPGRLDAVPSLFGKE
jgi:hypothetical protein